jgi:hypothetical protein
MEDRAQDSPIRVFCVSDLHTDHSKNWDLVYSWADENDYTPNGTSIRTNLFTL